MKNYYMGIDQGTTGTTVLLLDETWNQVSRGYKEITQIFPKPGWVEQDPMEIWQSVLDAARQAIEVAGICPGIFDRIRCIGLDNQGESVVMWDAETGNPLSHAIGWQDRRTAAAADVLKRQYGPEIRERTGLFVDAYFSATKIRWLMDHVPGAMEKIREGSLRVGTLDSWLLFKMTRGKVFATDVSTASRTMLFNIHTGDWDEEILRVLGIPREILPEICDSAHEFGDTDLAEFGGERIPIFGNVVDQQAALFGQACLKPGMAKATYGTGCFLLMNTGGKPMYSEHGLLTTVGWGIDGTMTFALDGGVYIAGAAIQWLRDRLKIIHSAKETDQIARSVPDTGDVFFVPAFSGLAAPHWDPYARGTLVGITGGTTREQIVRAALESIAYQVKDNLDVMRNDSGIDIDVLRVDGGASENMFLMQFQADILGIPVEVPEISEATALGAAYLAAYGIGDLKDLDAVGQNWKCKKRYEPTMDEKTRDRLLNRWHKAVRRSLRWECEIEDE